METAPTTRISSHGLFLPARRPWTRMEFERASELGLFRPDERLELIEGEIVQKVTPQNTPHATAIRACEEALRLAFPRGHDVRVQLPLALGDFSEPEPDVAVVTGTFRDYAREHPRSAVLVVEVSDTTLTYDRITKGSLYARARVPEYWLVNVPDRVLEVHRDPSAMEEQPLGHHYRSVTRHLPGESVCPIHAPATPVAVEDLLP